MNYLKRILSTEPVATAGLVEAAIALGVAFGLDLDGEQVAAILGFTALATAYIARIFVTPTTKVEAAE